TTVFVPDSPIDAAQALRLWELGQKSATAEWTLPPPGTANDLQTRAEVHGNGLRNAAGESSVGESSGQGSVKYAGPSDSRAVRRIAERVAENYLAAGGSSCAGSGRRPAPEALPRGGTERQGEESVEIRASVGDASPEPGSGCRPPTSSLPEICVKRRFTRTLSSSDRFGAPVIGAEIVEYDPLIVMATKGMNIDGSPLYSVFARNRREELLSHLEAADDGATDSGSTDSGATDSGGSVAGATGGSGAVDRGKAQPGSRPDRSAIDWDHKFDDDPPPF
ncbi:hypothetical protein, partial [Brevibacterium sp.]|uniref:hypothetical protein n=1 Tax=Brevibacterium sp. TaxID=1701 RepID=UPI0028110DAC